MKYGIAIFPPKKIQDVANSYRKRYDPHYALIPPHITLKDPFEAEDSEIKEMVPHLKEIAKEMQPFEIEINKVSSFTPITNTIYLKVEPTDIIMGLNEKLYGEHLPGEREHSFVPHITIAQKLSDDEYSDVYGTLRMKGFDLKETVDRFQLLYQLDNGSWTVYETFVLGEG
ncbi:2'-5' RNA ligase [Thalassobacillus cyri]|uniref:Putative phosphoesterase SAMN05421743_10191 n=1 Tax=Thalassobacillus cyri TaxID=571932 RepID=A0A1H3VMD8_9BACI|nr:YjcG family protein [Thalassobacillus cyri]SDZ75950.1 2'-5' RNA ligase [Thalassobacillus cyri]